MKKKIILFSSILFILDQSVKIIIDNFFDEKIVIIKNFFSINKSYNTGAAFSLFSELTIFLILINIVIFIFLIYYLKNFKENTRNLLAFSLVFGGLLGNLLDRILYGHVIDYLSFSFGNYNYPIFNLADSFVVIGVCLLFIAIIKKEDVYGNKS